MTETYNPQPAAEPTPDTDPNPIAPEDQAGIAAADPDNVVGSTEVEEPEEEPEEEEEEEEEAPEPAEPDPNSPTQTSSHS